MHCDYNKDEVYIKGHNDVYCRVDMQLALINNDELPTVITDDINDELQNILDDLDDDDWVVDEYVLAKDVPHWK